jgi:hypothetical protein
LCGRCARYSTNTRRNWKRAIPAPPSSRFFQIGSVGVPAFLPSARATAIASARAARSPW